MDKCSCCGNTPENFTPYTCSRCGAKELCCFCLTVAGCLECPICELKKKKEIASRVEMRQEYARA